MPAEIRKNAAGRYYWTLVVDGREVARSIDFKLKREAEEFGPVRVPEQPSQRRDTSQPDS